MHSVLKRLAYSLAAGLAALSLSDAAEMPVKGASDAPKVVMARVGEQEITAHDFMRYVSKDMQRVIQAKDPAGKARLLKAMLTGILLREALYREGLLTRDLTPTREQVIEAQQALAVKHFPAPPVPPEEELHAYYQRHPEEFGIPELVRVTQIQFRVPPGADAAARRAVRAGAEAALQRIQAGESAADVAAELTENPQAKAARGDLGFLSRNADPWLRDALRDLEPGDRTGVIESPVGYEILVLTDQRPPAVAPYASARARVISNIRREQAERRRAAYVHELAKEIGVTIEAEGLEGAVP